MGSIYTPKILERYYESNLERFVSSGKKYVLLEWKPSIYKSLFRTKFFAVMKARKNSPEGCSVYTNIIRKIPKK